MLKLMILKLLLGAVVGANSVPIVEPLNVSYQVTNDLWSCNLFCYHLGTDMVADANTEVHSICGGTVKEVTYRAESTNYGNRVLIECDGTLWDTVTVLYGHLGRDTTNPQTDDMFVAVGDTVTADQVIGRLGDSGENGGWIPHLHIGVHRGAYLGGATECGGWTYAGYTMESFSPTDSCYCGVMDNWIDPMEFLGIYPRNLRILEGTHSPEEGSVNDTEFTWHLSAVGGRNLPVSAKVIIQNPVDGNEYPFAMRYIEGTSSPFEWQFTKRLANVGEYFYRFSIETCADVNEEYGYHIGPTVTPGVPPCVPVREICDGIDNDCDSRTDENSYVYCHTACGNGQQSCDGGRLTACNAPEPQPETCNGTDDDCDGQTDEGLIQYKHNTCGNWTENCVAGVTILTSGTRREPTPEVCDSIDNDCNNLVDDNIRIACGNEFCPGERLCVSGNLGQCTGRTSAREICDDNDNDCDGQVDEGVKNACGECGQTPYETCNGRDDDCDDQTDESLTRSCSNTCGNTGTQACSSGNWGTCTAPACPPPCVSTTEVCDNRDNDCDGQIDESLTRSCSNTCGNTGTQTCSAGNWATCNATACPPPCVSTTEVCDNRDNDCDGQIDESLTRSCSNTCGNTGTQTCSAGNWGTCSVADCPIADIPEPEVCDNIDNDLDAQTDEGLTKSCTNECGNTGTQVCSTGNWGTCSAVACTPPPPPPPPPPPAVPQVTSAPGNTTPSNNYIGAVNIGAARTMEIRWGYATHAASYSYVVRQGNSGTVLAEGNTTNRYYYVSVPPSLYGTEISWQVRGVNSEGSPGPFSNSQSFFVSYRSGSVILCNDSACPYPNAWYLVSGDIASGEPDRLILDWISAACTAGRSPVTIPFSTMSGYSRSLRKNGCP